MKMVIVVALVSLVVLAFILLPGSEVQTKKGEVEPSLASPEDAHRPAGEALGLVSPNGDEQDDRVTQGSGLDPDLSEYEIMDSSQSAGGDSSRNLDEEFEAKYAGKSIHDLRGAQAALARKREELAMPLLKRKLDLGDYFQDEPIEGNQMYNLDTSMWHNDKVQPVVSVRLEPIPGTNLKVPKVIHINPDEDPDLLLASLEHLWLHKRVSNLAKKDR